MIEEVKRLADLFYDDAKSHREYLHQYPELSFQETETHQYIKSTLDKLGIAYRSGVGGGTGLIAEVGSGNTIVALRADIDALPITEEASHHYKSKNVGVMHACGHDVHTSCLLGAAQILKKLEGKLKGKVRLLFQPGEEKLPGGATLMIKDGALEGVSAIIGQHVHPYIPVGTLGYGSGFFMASADEIYITVEGKGGHAAMPEQVVDPILLSAEIIQGLQSVVSRRSNPNMPTVLSVGKINSVGGATNVIPDQVKMEGTLRTYNEDWRAESHDLITELVTKTAEAHGGSASIEIKKGYPCLYNDPALTKMVSEGMKGFIGAENVKLISPRMTAEDFAWYSQEIPACFFRLGTSGTDGEFTSPVHTPTFDIHPEAIRLGMSFMAFMAISLLKQY